MDCSSHCGRSMNRRDAGLARPVSPCRARGSLANPAFAADVRHIGGSAYERAFSACLPCLALTCTGALCRQVDWAFPIGPEHVVNVPPKVPGRCAEMGPGLRRRRGPGPFRPCAIATPADPCSSTCSSGRSACCPRGTRWLVVDSPGTAQPNSNLDHGVSVTSTPRTDVAGMRHLRSLAVVDGKAHCADGISYGAMAGCASERRFSCEKSGRRTILRRIVSVYPWCNQQVGRTRQDHQFNFYGDTDVRLLVVLGAGRRRGRPALVRRTGPGERGQGIARRVHGVPGHHARVRSTRGCRTRGDPAGRHSVTYRYKTPSRSKRRGRLTVPPFSRVIWRALRLHAQDIRGGGVELTMNHRQIHEGATASLAG